MTAARSAAHLQPSILMTCRYCGVWIPALTISCGPGLVAPTILAREPPPSNQGTWSSPIASPLAPWSLPITCLRPTWVLMAKAPDQFARDARGRGRAYFMSTSVSAGTRMESGIPAGSLRGFGGHDCWFAPRPVCTQTNPCQFSQEGAHPTRAKRFQTGSTSQTHTG